MDGVYLHVVTYDADGDQETMTWRDVERAHHTYVSYHHDPTTTPPPTPTFPHIHRPLLQPPPTPPPPPPTPPAGFPLPLPDSLKDYPIRVWRDGRTHDAHFTHRTFSAAGQHHWYVHIDSDPATAPPQKYDTAEINLLISRNSTYNIRAPTKKIPEIHYSNLSIDALPPTADGAWAAHHPIVGELASVRVPAPLPPAHLGAPATPSPRRSRRPTITVSVAAAFTKTGDSHPSQFLAYVLHDRTKTVLFTNASDLAEAAHSRAAHSLRSSHATGSREARRHFCNLQLGDHSPDDEFALPDGTLPAITAAAHALGRALPADAAELLGEGYRILPKQVPRPVRRAYRTVLSSIWALTSADDNTAHLWRAALVFDSLVLAPPRANESFLKAIRRRLTLFLDANIPALLAEGQHQRKPSPTPPPPTATDANAERAVRAQETLLRFRSITGAMKRLRAPIAKTPISADATAAALRKLNPAIGSPIPPPPQFHPVVQGGGDAAPPTPPPQIRPAYRRHIQPPTDAPPAPLQVTTDQVLRKIRSTDTAAAGGPTGQTYITLRTWFDEDDAATDHFVAATNNLIANKVPPSIIPLLTAARGLAIPKDEEGNLRPIAVGSVLLRFVASLALGLSHKETDAYFLGAHAKAKQFGIGVASGCNLMAAAIESHLRQNPTHIAIGADSRSAFNTYDRSVMWAIARAHFPTLNPSSV